ncbi:MAG: hypothetical protein QXT58_03970 [Archaeoglobaceae archaeon]
MRNYRFQGDKLMDHSSRNTPLILTPLVVNIVIISAILVRVGYLYNKSMNAYSWILGTAIMALLCAIALYAFIGGYVSIKSNKKLYKRALICAASIHITSLTIIAVVMIDYEIFLGLISSMATTAISFVSLITE